MSGVVHFKFKSSNAYDSVGFEGAFVSVGELKVLIAEKKGLSKDATSELLLSDPRTQVADRLGSRLLLSSIVLACLQAQICMRLSHQTFISSLENLFMGF